MYVDHLHDSIEEFMDIMGITPKSVLQPPQEDYIFDILQEEGLCDEGRYQG